MFLDSRKVQHSERFSLRSSKLQSVRCIAFAPCPCTLDSEGGEAHGGRQIGFRIRGMDAVNAADCADSSLVLSRGTELVALVGGIHCFD